MMRMPALSKKKELHVVGVMNGTSLDGVDYTLCKVKKVGRNVVIKYVDQIGFPFSAEWKQRLLKAAEHQMNVAELAILHHDLGKLYAEHFKKLKNKKWKIDLFGVHGQTVFHAPPKATLQIGEMSYLSAAAEVPVVSDFRVADIAHGGQGAPIASLFHQQTFQKQFAKKILALQNIGGIGNVTLMDRKGNVLCAFDTGPGNMLMDLLVQRVTAGKDRFDKSGRTASRGIPHEITVEKALKHEYFQKKPPKSAGREEFGESLLNDLEKTLKGLSFEDKMATLAELTARSIAESYQKHCSIQPEVLVICGGGGNNDYLLKRIQYHLPKTKVITTKDLDWPLESIEGAAFALLAAYRAWNIPSNLPKTTGAKKAVTLGKITEAF